MPKVVERVLRAGEGRTLKKLEAIAAQVNIVEEDFEKLTDAELREETDRFRKRLADGQSLDQILPEAFAAVREAANAQDIQVLNKPIKPAALRALLAQWRMQRVAAAE